MDQNQLITMTPKEAKRYEIIKNLLATKLDGTEASKQLSLSIRQTKRLKAKVKLVGIRGIIHGNRGRESNRQISKKIIKRAKEYLNKTYHDFNPLLAQEHLRDDQGIKLCKETVRQLMIKEKLWQPRKKTAVKKHFWRERKDNYGEMEQFDGCYHNWFEGRNEAEIGLEQCLLVSVDDATGSITKAKFGDHEGIKPVFGYWHEYFGANGLPTAIYLDKFSTYKINHKNAVDNKELMTQFERAMKQLGVRVIHANSPQAKGRVEKMNDTLQRRLVKELRLNNINTTKEANQFLKEVFVPKFNQQFRVAPKKKNNLHVKLGEKRIKELDQILSIQNERKVNNDYTVRFENNYYQLTEAQPTTVYKKDKVTIEERLNGEVRISLRNHYLNYSCLPNRPQKEININLAALTVRKQANWIPPANHPWRKQFINKKEPVLLTTGQGDLREV